MKRHYVRAATSLLVFVLLLVLLNFLFSELDWGVHISIVGSVVLSLVVWGCRGAGTAARGKKRP